MKKFRRVLSALMLFCMVLTLLPPVQFVHAATAHRYELDTDGIDVGANYLIVNTATAGTAHALRYTGVGNKYGDQSLTVQNENGICYIAPGFTNEETCLFTFSDASSGTVQSKDGTGILDLSRLNDTFFNSTTRNMRFTDVGNGAYRICYNNWYYLQYSNASWKRYSGSSNVYLFKQVEYEAGYDITFDGNGYTSGTLPQDVTSLEPGASYTIPEPVAPLRKDIGEDTWLFLGWNTKADGSGQAYRPGDTITVAEAMVLYADWYQQTKYSASMITYLDGVETDVDKISGQDKHFYAQLEGGDGTFIPLNKTQEGTYTAKVTENGTYIIYAKVGDGDYETVHGHKVVIYNQDAYTECAHYSITYDVNGGAWAEGEAITFDKCHKGETVVAYDKVPAMEGYIFLGWQDAAGNRYAPGQTITTAADKPIVLTAQWQKSITVTVNFTINHNAVTGGTDNSDKAQELHYVLLRVENGVNVPVKEDVLDGGQNDEQGKTVYTVNYENMPQGIYRVASVKSNYETEIIYDGGAEENQTISVNHVYKPTNFDVTFAVKVHADEGEEELMPDAVNIKISYWGYNSEEELGWHIITQQSGNTAPITAMIDENGEGSGFYPVWKTWSDSDYAYEYRVEITSFIMPDGSVVKASGDGETYRADGSGLYEATVSVDRGGRSPEGETLSGVYYDGNGQNGELTVNVEITPFTVRFDAGEGKVNDQQSITLENQYRYPDLNNYIAVPNGETEEFLGWMVEGQLAENAAGQLLMGDVTYKARYSTNVSLSGDITVDATYQDNGQTVQIIGNDRADEVLVILQKKVDNGYSDVDACIAKVTYGDNAVVGECHYAFPNLPNDGSEYRVQVLTPNYTAEYDNNQDQTFSAEETVVQVNTQTFSAQVDIHMTFEPESYLQSVRVDASQIGESMRPTDALVQVLYRDLGDIHTHTVISQHTVSPYGIQIPMDPTSHSSGSGAEEVWIRHTDGGYYEYQAQLYKLYGGVKGAYTLEGTEYTSDSPYTVEYGAPSSYLDGEDSELTVTLVPKTYPITLDMGLDDDTDAVIYGVDQFMVDDGTGNISYAYNHTWSHSDTFSAFPFREGYVFECWESNHDSVVVGNDGGTIIVPDGLAEHVTLTAHWRKLEGAAYAVRHLELNTEKPLQGAEVVEDVVVDSEVKAVEHVLNIEGYSYAGAKVGDKMYGLTENAVLTVSNEPAKNVLTIYYVKDGYTDQVESNLKLDKSVALTKNGTYTINLETYTMNNPVTTMVLQDTPLDIVLVLDQSGSVVQDGYLDDLQAAVDSFVEEVANHGRRNEVDHRIAIVGYASNATAGATNSNTTNYPLAGGTLDEWVNTGVFDSNGDFHPYPVTGFNYTAYTGTVEANGIYYTYSHDAYLLLDYHSTYHHLITEEEARKAELNNTTVYGYVYDKDDKGEFVELERNSSGLWLYGDKQLYSAKEFFTYHTDVWTHRNGLERREIHAYGTGSNFSCVDGHDSIFTRTETRNTNPELDIYRDALMPVSFGVNGSGRTNPNLINATQSLGSNGGTYVQYGIEMANKIFAANPADGRVRIMVTFTDGKPGNSGFDETVANEAISLAYTTKNTHKAHVYTIGLYSSTGVDSTSDVAVYMNAMSSNYPDAKDMDDVMVTGGYVTPADGSKLNDGGSYYYKQNNTYYLIKWGNVTTTSNSWYKQDCWYYTRSNRNYRISTTYDATITDGKVGSNTVYVYRTGGYVETPYSGYYSTTENDEDLRQYFANIMQEITSNITTEVILHEDTILRDIMGQGLILTPNTVITAYKVPGSYNPATGQIDWGEIDKEKPVAQITMKGQSGNNAYSPETTTVSYTLDDGTEVTKENVPYISVYNLQAKNSLNPNQPDYHPHTIDITGYDFENDYIKEDHPGYKMIVEITGVEATDEVQWGCSTATNNEQSGLWLPADKDGKRQLLMAFNQPTTIFVERAYVLDYGKEFTLSKWYFDDEDGKNATPVHLDLNIADGMNGFETPVTANTVNGNTGNIEYGNVKIENGEVMYSPTSMNWHGYDQFYVFGQTWRKTVLAQTANKNGVPEDDGLANLWNKVTVIPANNIYYEDSFITKDGGAQNGIEGFTFTGDWTVVGTEDGNRENPEHIETEPYGNVHGWTDSLGDDTTYTDGTAHATGLKGEMGARAEFTFTGTGVEVYTRTNAKSGMVVAILSRKTVDAEGKETTVLHKSLAVDNLTMSGDYYHIPTVAFNKLPYGTYTLQLIATAATSPETGKRYEYYIDGVRILNPLGNEANNQSGVVKDAYELETNAVFTEVRDILLDNGSFSADQDKIKGAVFIDWIKDGQETGDDAAGKGKPTYEIGTFEDYGPKSEVYLSAGQAIVLKVEEGNNYFVGLKSLKGTAVTANLNGIEDEEPTTIQLTHTTDMYYRVTPINGYIVIQNGSTGDSILSVTNLRTTNLKAPVENGGVLRLAQEEALEAANEFTELLLEVQNRPPETQEPEVTLPSAQDRAESNLQMANELFVDVRQWLDEE